MSKKSTTESVLASSVAAAALIAAGAIVEPMEVVGWYDVECYDADGNLKWTDRAPNLVTNVGKIDILDKYFGGSGYTAAFYLGLVASGPTFNAADTMGSHAGWTEDQTYSQGTRPAVSWNGATGTGGGAGSAGTGAKASTATAFSINGSVTIAGCFLTTVATKGGTTGTLYSAGAFTGGNRAVQSGDTLNVTYTANC